MYESTGAMPYRDAFTRIVDQVGRGSFDVGPFNLWWAALSAAEERFGVLPWSGLG